MKFICQREALVTVSYEDGRNEDGSPKYSIGFGSQTPPPQVGDSITIEDAFARVKVDISDRAKIVDRVLDFPVEQHEFDALVSLFYQSGTAALNDVAEWLSLGDRNRAMIAMSSYVKKEDGTFSIGLMKRRHLELMIFAKADYGDLSMIKVYNGDPKIVRPIEMPFPVEAST